MSEADPFYLTTAIFYPSPGPALHSLFEAVGADALARYQRLSGRPVRFLTGMDDQPLLSWVPVFLLNFDSAGWNSSQMLVPVGTKGYSFQGRIFAADLSAGPPYAHALGSTFSMEVN